MRPISKFDVKEVVTPQKKFKPNKNSQSGSVVIISLLLISAVLMFVAFSVDLSSHLLANSKVKLINEVSALAGIVRFEIGETESEARNTSEQTARINLASSKGVSWVNDDDAVIAVPDWSGFRAKVTVRSKHQLNTWFSRVIGGAAGEKEVSDSVAVIDTATPKSDAPLHVILLTESSFMNNCTREAFVHCDKDTGKDFSLALIDKLSDTDYLSLIAYAGISKVVFKKLKMDRAGKDLAVAELSKVGRGYFGSGNEEIGNMLGDYYAMPASAIVAARAVLQDTGVNEREAIVIPSEAAIWDFDAYGYMHEYIDSFFAAFSVETPDLRPEDGWYSINTEEAQDLSESCGRIPNTSLILEEMVSTDLGTELSVKIIDELQKVRDLRAYTVSMRPVDPSVTDYDYMERYEITGLGVLPQDSYGYVHDYQIEIADDPGYAHSYRNMRQKCTANRPKEKQGKYFPYTQTNNNRTANELLHHARYAPFSDPGDKHFFKPTLIDEH